MTQIYLTDSPQKTQALAGKLIGPVSKQNLICLYGELGSGKTTFIQGLAQALSIKEKVISPTFILMREYQISYKLQVTSYKFFVHIDCYRIESEKDVKGIDFAELWQDKRNLVVIEWADRIKKILPKERLDICFPHIE